MNKTNDSEFKSGLLKEISVIGQATERMATENGGTLLNIFQFCDTTNNVNALANYLYSINTCTDNIDAKGCWHKAGNWYASDGTAPTIAASSFYSQNGGMVLKDGSLLLLTYTGSPSCTNSWMHQEGSGTIGAIAGIKDCEIIFVDVNGFKKPNKISKDIFALSIREPGIVFPGVNTEYNTGIGCASKTILGQKCP